MTEEPCVSCTTFNILAPIYKRLDQKNQSVRESNFRSVWLSRNQKILNWLLHERSSIICLQEFWVGNEELVHMYRQRLGDAGYMTFQLARTNNRGDGLLTAVHKDYYTILNCQELLFHDCGDRVAQLHQVYKILQYVEQYQRENKLNLMPILLCGDWNGSKSGHVYKFLRSQGFVSSYDIAHEYTDSYADAHRWVSHRNHRGNICGVDFIWLCNPIKSREPLKKSWSEAVFGIIKCQLQKASFAEKDAFAFLKADNHGNFITYSAFCEALRQVNLIGLPYGLSSQETEDLWMQADINGNGVVGYEEFKRRIWNSEYSELKEENCSERTWDSEQGIEEEAIGFKVKKAVLFPREAEKGMWPENYSLSDHAPLTVIFCPRLPFLPTSILLVLER
ncbi:hypothetical protein OIU84_012611 [Salix udensis]|uniref:Endonuclease/exonuclease/phosphatase domain-containing protein n=1 Tax=Salix udensis TaxID=889485 RepID=A0AAD6NTF5_9ROSI|nr:hypothetical protein OIU84_012611 [Salix udensis]